MEYSSSFYSEAENLFEVGLNHFDDLGSIKLILFLYYR